MFLSQVGMCPSPAPYREGFHCELGLAGQPPEVAAGGPGRSPTVKVLAASLMSGLSGRGVLFLKCGRPPATPGSGGRRDVCHPGSVCNAARAALYPRAAAWPSSGSCLRQPRRYVTLALRHLSVPRTRLRIHSASRPQQAAPTRQPARPPRPLQGPSRPRRSLLWACPRVDSHLAGPPVSAWALWARSAPGAARGRSSLLPGPGTLPRVGTRPVVRPAPWVLALSPLDAFYGLCCWGRAGTCAQ